MCNRVPLRSGLVVRSRRSRRSGVALVYVLMTIGIVGLVGVSILRGQRSAQLIETAHERRVIASTAAQGGAHRALALLRRDKNLRGFVTEPGPEALLGVTTTISIADRTDGHLSLLAVCNYLGAYAEFQIVVDPSRL